MQSQCREQVEVAFQRAEKHFNRKIKRVPVTFSNRMTHTAGSAHAIRSKCGNRWESTEIRLSAKLLAANGARFIKETPGHEAAHIIVNEIFGGNGKPHGMEWRQVMRIIGINPDVTHDYATPKATKLFKYRDSDGVIRELTIIRHNKLQRGKVGWYAWKDGIKVTKNDFIGQK